LNSGTHEGHCAASRLSVALAVEQYCATSEDVRFLRPGLEAFSLDRCFVVLLARTEAGESALRYMLRSRRLTVLDHLLEVARFSSERTVASHAQAQMMGSVPATASKVPEKHAGPVPQRRNVWFPPSGLLKENAIAALEDKLARAITEIDLLKKQVAELKGSSSRQAGNGNDHTEQGVSSANNSFKTAGSASSTVTDSASSKASISGKSSNNAHRGPSSANSFKSAGSAARASDSAVTATFSSESSPPKVSTPDQASQDSSFANRSVHSARSIEGGPAVALASADQAPKGASTVVASPPDTGANAASPRKKSKPQEPGDAAAALAALTAQFRAMSQSPPGRSSDSQPASRANAARRSGARGRSRSARLKAAWGVPALHSFPSPLGSVVSNSVAREPVVAQPETLVSPVGNSKGAVVLS